MPIKIIKKRHVEEARPPAPLIDTPPPIKAEAKPSSHRAQNRPQPEARA